jgi:hypothetical protein
VFVPLPVLDATFADKPFLERDELRVGPLHTLRGLDKLLDRILLTHDVAYKTFEELLESGRRLLGQLSERLLELLLDSDLLLVELTACPLKLPD